MKRSWWLLTALIGFISSLVVMAVSFLANLAFGLPFLPFDLFEGLTRVLPGPLVERGISIMVSIITTLHLGPTAATAKLAEQLQGLGLVAITGIVIGLILGWISRRRPAYLRGAGLVAGFVLWIGMALAEAVLPQTAAALLIGLLFLLALLVGWGWVMARLIAPYQVMPVTAPEPASGPGAKPVLEMPGRPSRRNFLWLMGSGLASVAVLAVGIGNNRQQSSTVSIPDTGAAGSGDTAVPTINLPFGPQYTSGPAASPSQDVLDKRLDPAPGTRVEVTTPDTFYRIDINLFPPKVDAAAWRLTIKGLVNKPAVLTLNDIVSRPSVTQALTMACISNYVGGDLISSNYWTGVRLKDVLADVGLKSGAAAISITAADGFFESVPMAEAMDDRTLLVYAMNGQALTPDHGFPLRIYIPNHYGMKQPKWITQMEVTDTVSAGYWVERGWSETAIPQTTAAIDTVIVDKAVLAASGVMPLGGVAWAGARGISKVELQIDGAPWVEAELRNPTLSPLTWVQWRYDWKATPGTHQVRARATDGLGALQEAVDNGPGPEGATGYHVVNIQV
jgi:DMSO/TMAO reductase YedYZ molybdopterin-dependent catalytic subunit